MTSSRRVQVLHLVQNMNYGGMERLIADMTRRATHSQFEMHILALDYLGHFSEGLDQYATLSLASDLSRWSMLRPSSLAVDIAAIKPDVVHLHSGLWYKGSLAARMAGVPRIIYTEHGRRRPDPWTHRFIDGIASRRTDVIVAVSELLSTQLSRIVHDPARIHVIRNGVDTTRYVPQDDTGALRQELGISPDAPILGSVGRLEPIKGYDVMISAFASLLRDWTHGSRPQLVLVGDGSERSALERQVSAAGIRDKVHFLGWRNDIHECHRAFTVFTMSSRSEGTSVSLLEAMSAGLCPVVTNVGGNAAVLGETLQHRLTPSEQPVALTAAWREVLGNPERRHADACLARERVTTHFSLDAMTRAYETLYLTSPTRSPA